MVGMHIHIIPNRNSTPAVLLRESYRVGGNVRKRTLANLSKLPMDAVDAIRRILKGEKLVSVEVAFKIVENGSRHHGHVDAVLSAMRQLGFEKLVGSRHSPERDLVVAMVVARILEPQSKLATSQSSGPASGRRHLFRTMLLRRRSSVRKLEARLPSSSFLVCILRRAASERFAGATGSRLAFACWSSSENSSGRQASIMCHRT